jgi:hypothetical protein
MILTYNKHMVATSLNSNVAEDHGDLTLPFESGDVQVDVAPIEVAGRVLQAKPGVRHLLAVRGCSSGGVPGSG